MPIVVPVDIPALATPLPDPADRNTYGTRGRLVWEWEFGALVPGLNASADAAFQNASHAQNMAEIAQAASNFVGDWEDQTGALNKPASVFHSGSYWVLVNNLANVTTSTPGVSADWRELAISASAVSVIYDNTTSGLSATSVQAAIDEVVSRLSQGLGFNLLDNPRFAINQKAVSGTVVLAAGVTGHDRWKAGVGGCTYTFSASGGVTTLNISAGSLISVIEGETLQAGNHTLSWGGTAQGKIGAGSYAASPITASVTGGTNLSIEFGTGTLNLVQFERGNVAHLFSGRSYGADLALCQRFCNSKNVRWRLDEAWNTGVGIYFTDHYPTMRNAPTPTITVNASTNFGTPTLHSNKVSCTTWLITTAVAGPAARELDFAVRYEAHL